MNSKEGKKLSFISVIEFFQRRRNEMINAQRFVVVWVVLLLLLLLLAHSAVDCPSASHPS